MTNQATSTILVSMSDVSIHEQHAVHPILYHIIFCPKRRRKVLVGPVYDRLKAKIEQVAAENQWRIARLAIQPDPVHLFIQTNPSTTPTDVARLIKGCSSKQVREEFAHLKRMPSLWTRSPFYSPAGHVSQERIDTSIARQSTS